ncbi:hypothetical protein MYCTH_2110320 [Thermothelomyces thermophilus ATCC 42464]|uniref:Uncharacterized protein n=1 Tax=Thermothelomyces thermophilus (strain ATCC 42464 / BCRC 31852 / DSM 1799) TaxID=573729 RepID=G2QBL3_THET4|nr:uncharacterized protein MYCTH_2110320 [Thermothelomyces thermophilus ATCC 42464]AEO57956.1 hypothetical protein MYCTH_2110320 [Thermothelomyces thermophilus ATCC 42464]
MYSMCQSLSLSLSLPQKRSPEIGLLVASNYQALGRSNVKTFARSSGGEHATQEDPLLQSTHTSVVLYITPYSDNGFRSSRFWARFGYTYLLHDEHWNDKAGLHEATSSMLDQMQPHATWPSTDLRGQVPRVDERSAGFICVYGYTEPLSPPGLGLDPGPREPNIRYPSTPVKRDGYRELASAPG